MEKALVRLKRSLQIKDCEQDELLEELLEEAREFVLSQTYRDVLPERMRGGWVLLARLYYDRQGMEGETSHSEGGISRTMEALPQNLRDWIIANRLTPGVLRARRAAAPDREGAADAAM